MVGARRYVTVGTMFENINIALAFVTMVKFVLLLCLLVDRGLCLRVHADAYQYVHALDVVITGNISSGFLILWIYTSTNRCTHLLTLLPAQVSGHISVHLGCSCATPVRALIHLRQHLGLRP